MRLLKFLTIILLFTLPLSARNYYFSAQGNDANKGTKPTQAMRSIEGLATLNLKAGDSVLFRRGDTFYGQIVVKNSGKANKPIVYSAYGQGNQPILSGAVVMNNWAEYKNGAFTVSIEKPVYQVYSDNKQQINARYPNVGLLRMDGGFGNKTAFVNNDLTQKDGYWEKATIRYRTCDWEIKTSMVTEYKNQAITIRDSSTNTLAKGWGYYFDNKFEELDTISEWFYNPMQKKLYYIPEHKNISQHLIEASVFEKGFTLQKGVNHVTIDGLDIRKFEEAGIYGAGDNQFITLSNNQISYVNKIGIEFIQQSKNCVINNNTINSINGLGIRATEPVDMKITGNSITEIGNIMGYGISGVNGMIGIAIVSIEEAKSPTSNIARNNLIANNRVENIGYVGIRMDGANSIMENNYINNCMIQLSDGAAIYCWAKSENYTYNNIIRNNIVENIKGNNIGTPSESNPIALGIYVDNRCYNIRVEGNTVLNSTGSGIHVNCNAYDNLIKSNLIYNCTSGLSVAEWSYPNSTYNNVFEENIVFSTNNKQNAIELSNWLIPSIKSIASFNHNTYYQFFEKYFIKEAYVSEDKASKVKHEFSFGAWQKQYGYDADSRAYEVDSSFAKYDQSKLVFNNTMSVKTVDLTDKAYFDLTGKSVSSVKLKPFTSAILLYK